MKFIAVNETDGQVEFAVWRIDEGTSFEEWAARNQEARANAEAGGPVMHAPSYLSDMTSLDVEAGESASLVRTVRSGTYGIVCLRLFPQVGMRPFALVGPIEVR